MGVWKTHETSEGNESCTQKSLYTKLVMFERFTLVGNVHLCAEIAGRTVMAVRLVGLIGLKGGRKAS